MQLTRSTALVFVIGFAIGWLLVAFVPTLGLNAGTLALVVAILIWLLRVAPRPDMPFSLIGVVLGILLALLVPALSLAGVVDAGVAIGVTWLLLVSAA